MGSRVSFGDLPVYIVDWPEREHSITTVKVGLDLEMAAWRSVDRGQASNRVKMRHLRGWGECQV